MDRQRGLVEGVRDGLIGLRVVLGLQFGLRALPQRACGVDLLRLRLGGFFAFFLFRSFDQLDRKQDVVRIGRDHAADLVAFEIFLRVVLQVQHDLGAARHTLRLALVRRRDVEAGAAGRGPHPRLGRSRTAARHRDPVGHHEGRVEPDTELADQAGAVLRLGELIHEGARAGARDRAEVVDQFLPVHADAVVGDGQRAGRLVGRDADREVAAFGRQFGLGDRLVAQPVEGIGGVGDQLAQKNVGLGIDRVHHHAQQFGHLGLELVGFGRLRCLHASVAHHVCPYLDRTASDIAAGPRPARVAITGCGGRRRSDCWRACRCSAPAPARAGRRGPRRHQGHAGPMRGLGP